MKCLVAEVCCLGTMRARSMVEGGLEEGFLLPSFDLKSPPQIIFEVKEQGMRVKNPRY